MKKTVDKRTRKRKLIRNLVLIVLLPALLWFLMGMCPLSAKGAFRRAMRENFVTGVEPQVVIDTSDPYFNRREYIVLGEKDNVVYQAAVRPQSLLKFKSVLQVGDTVQPSHPLSSPSPPAFNLSQHQGLYQ